LFHFWLRVADALRNQGAQNGRGLRVVAELPSLTKFPDRAVGTQDYADKLCVQFCVWSSNYNGNFFEATTPFIAKRWAPISHSMYTLTIHT
jgi:hypothetical protein